ncbi:MAG TPA: hypothetical protein RMH99_14190 [Sandaracinaceae bacterium LLY-WYZ-13_1]|nr:hypothetical protein [Sandaracinaceae bacterium LLY-WYZ-13_1]
MSVTVEQTREGAHLRLETRGLAERGRPELEMVGVPPELAKEARAVLEIIGDRVAGAPRLERLVGAPLEDSVVVVALEPAGDRARVVAPDADADREAPPWPALASLTLDRALAALEDGDDATGERLLRESLARFAGEPARAADLPRLGPDYNRENCLTYRALAFERPGTDGPRLFAEALRRSEVLSLVEVGGALEDLEEPDYTHVAELARFIAYDTLNDDPVEERLSSSLALMRSPIWYVEHTGEVARGRGPWPLRFLDLYWRGPARRAVASEWAIEAVVDAVARSREEPLALLEHTFVTNALWREVAVAPLRSTGRPFVPPSRLLSLMLAQVAYGAAAGLDRDAIRASLGAGSGADRARALAALAEFEPTLDGWRSEAIDDGG